MWASVSLQGLLLDGERKSMEPLARRVTLPAGLAVQDQEQALQPFVNQSPWDEAKVRQRYRRAMAGTFASPQGIFLFDDVCCPKQGTHSVGVQRQYGDALGKKANCQLAVRAHHVSPQGPYPLDLRLYLPDSWRNDEARLDAAGVPAGQRRALTQPAIALELLDGARAEGLPGWAVVADAGYGVSGDFRDGLEARELSYIVGRRPRPDHSGNGQRGWPVKATKSSVTPTRPRLAEGNPGPLALSERVKKVRLRRVTWRQGSKGKLSGRFAWLRSWPGQGWQTGDGAGKGPVGLVIEEQADGKSTYAVSNLPEGTSLKKAVRLWKNQPMKEELGLDHFAGRSWRGFHHHAARVILADGFLLLERHRGHEHPVKPGKKGGENRF